VSHPARSGQLSLFGREEPALDEQFSAVRRVTLEDGAWIDYVPSWLQGHASVFETLAETVRWHVSHQHLYDKRVQTPRLVAVLPEDGPIPKVFERMRRALSSRYGEDFVRVSLAWYRDGRDSVAWHGDRVARNMPEALVATVSVGAPRRLLLRRSGGGPSLAFELGLGDLFVMGGTCQRTWQHSVPKVAHAHPRIAIMFRPAWAEAMYARLGRGPRIR
jgi:alkylated DNA repair dioxygenase AlkB